MDIFRFNGFSTELVVIGSMSHSHVPTSNDAVHVTNQSMGGDPCYGTLKDLIFTLHDGSTCRFKEYDDILMSF